MNDYIYPNMTPELQAYLDAQHGHPGYKYPKDAEGNIIHTPTPKSKAAVDAWAARKEALKAQLPSNEPHDYFQAHKAWYCRDETQVGDPKEHVSPSGRYRLVVTSHTTGPGTWNYSKGRVYEGDRLLETVCRNYGSFPFLFVEDHPNGHSYILAGEDYQGQTLIELDTGHRVDDRPSAASQGFGFCWASYSVSPSKRTLAVSGCFWACPYEVWFVDFSNPMEFPLPVLKRDADAEQFFDWTGSDRCEIGRSFDIYIPLDKREDDLTEADWDDVETREQSGATPKDLWRMGRETITWTRPSDLEIAHEAVRFLVDGWVQSGRPVPQDFLTNAHRLIARIPEELQPELLQKLQGA